MYRVPAFELRPVALLAIAAAVLAFAPPASGAASCVGNGDYAQVKINFKEGKLSVDPGQETVSVYMGSKNQGKTKLVCWYSHDLKDDEYIHVKTDPSKYPPSDRTPAKMEKFRAPSHRSFGRRPGYRSSSVPEKSGTWRYKIWVENAEKILDVMDPRVVIVNTDRPGAGG